MNELRAQQYERTNKSAVASSCITINKKALLLCFCNNLCVKASGFGYAGT